TPCKAACSLGDVCSVNDIFLEVTAPGPAPDRDGHVQDVRVRALLDRQLTNPGALLGQGSLLTPYDVNKPRGSGCWVSFTPPPQELPQDKVSPDARIVLHFSEPMDPTTVDGLENLQLIRGDSRTEPTSSTIVVARVAPSLDLRDFTLRPELPLAH